LKNKAIFLDRDGVVNKAIVKRGKPYPPQNIEELILTENVRYFLNLLKDQNYKLIVVTNQPDVARKITSREMVNNINNYLLECLPIDSVETCFHDDYDRCSCRKPLPGLILKAAHKYDINLKASYLIGDRWKDISAGMAASCKTIFIDYKYNEYNSIKADFNVLNLKEAVQIILKRDEI